MEYERVGGLRHPGRAAVIVVLLVTVVGIFLLQNGVFVVRSVTVEGATLYTPEQVVQIAGIHSGQSVFTIDQQAVAENLSRDRYLLLDSLYINYPSELILRVRERKSSAALPWLGVLNVLDSECRVLEKSAQLDTRMQVPVITGADVLSDTIGQTLATREPAQLEAIRAVLGELALQSVTARISELNVANLDNLYLITQEGMKILLGNGDELERKVGLMRAVLDELAAEGKVTGSLDVSTVTVADYRAVPIHAAEYLPDATAVPPELVGR